MPQQLALCSSVFQQWHCLKWLSSDPVVVLSSSSSGINVDWLFICMYVCMMAIVYFLLSKCLYKYTYINYHVLTYIHKYMCGVNPLSYLQIYIQYIYTYITILLVLTASPSICAAAVLSVSGWLPVDLFSCSHPAAVAPLPPVVQ